MFRYVKVPFPDTVCICKGKNKNITGKKNAWLFFFLNTKNLLLHFQLGEYGFGHVAVCVAPGAFGARIVGVEVDAAADVGAFFEQAVGAIDDDDVLVHIAVVGRVVAADGVGACQVDGISEAAAGAFFKVDHRSSEFEVVIVLASGKQQDG